MNRLESRQKGFTLIELVMVIVLLGILSVGVSGLFSSKSSYAEYIAKEQLISQGLLAQQIAFGMSATSDPVSLSVTRSSSGQTSFSLTKVGQPPLTELLDTSLNSPLVDGSALANGTSVTFIWNSKAGMSDNTKHSITFVGDKSYRVCFSASGYVYESSVACP
jgi:prepilin-type N-terminal cleavage/methylation domain-containing protein